MTDAHAPAVAIDVVVPTYRRPRLLERCLNALSSQIRQPERVVVVARRDDTPAHDVVHLFSPHMSGLVLVLVEAPGVLAAMSAGVAASAASIVAFTDDDAAPRPDWIARLLVHFDDPTVGAVGGRDVISGQEGPLTTDVGVFRREGRLVGNHHLGTGPARDVHVLKGVNMAFRASALALPAPAILRGSGAQVDFEIMCCAYARGLGLRVVYDPAVIVDHAAAPRHGADRRLRPELSAVFDAAYNSVVATCALEPRTAMRRICFGIFVGTGDRPGFVRGLVGLVRRESETLRRAAPALSGRLRGLLWLLCRPVGAMSSLMVTAAELRGSPKCPRVALVAHDVHDHGGMERACAELIRQAHQAVSFTVVATDLADELRPLVERWVPVSVPRRPFPMKFSCFFLRAGFIIRRLDVDLVHTVGAVVPNKVDVATIHFCHAGYRAATGHLAPTGAPLDRRLNTTIARALALLAERWCYRRSRLRVFAAVSQGVAAEVATHYPDIPVPVTPNGIDTSRFRPDPEQRDTMRAQHSIAAGQCVALFVGGDWDRKGLALTLEAVAKARADGADVMLWVVGLGDRERFAAVAAELGIDTAVSFFGQHDAAECFYQGADLFVLPSGYETFGIVCFEAAACGLPLVIPTIHGAAALVGDDEAGVIVQRDAASIAGAVARLAHDPLLRLELGAEAARRACAFTWEASAEAVVGLYHQLLNGELR